MLYLLPTNLTNLSQQVSRQTNVNYLISNQLITYYWILNENNKETKLTQQIDLNFKKKLFHNLALIVLYFRQ